MIVPSEGSHFNSRLPATEGAYNADGTPVRPKDAPINGLAWSKDTPTAPPARNPDTPGFAEADQFRKTSSTAPTSLSKDELDAITRRSQELFERFEASVRARHAGATADMRATAERAMSAPIPISFDADMAAARAGAVIAQAIEAAVSRLVLSVPVTARLTVDASAVSSAAAKAGARSE